MNWKLPNQLTVGRMVIAAAFFVLLGMYDAEKPGMSQWLLNIAFVLYILAGITDVLDGYFARKWNITTAFGRITDPVVDKVLVVGAFVMLCGRNFAAGDAGVGLSAVEQDLPYWLTGYMLTAVRPWMVVVILSREFLVSAVRGYSESQGIVFPATSAGKIKMFLQSFAICTVIYQVANVRDPAWAVWMKIITVWISMIATVLSGLAYIGKARKLLVTSETKDA